MATYNLFISHSWRYSDAYDRLVNLLNERGYFSFNNYSVPKDDPVHNANNDKQLRAAILNHMRPCHVVIVLGGVYATYSKWITEELDLAENGFKQRKRVIAVRPRGNVRLSTPVQEAADEIVGWNSNSLVDAIRRLS